MQNRYYFWFTTKYGDVYSKNDLNKKDHSREVHIVGHSLSSSDKYILLDIIEYAEKIIIYYFTEADKESKITNLYKILGDEKFYKYVNNISAKHKIMLKPQSDVEIK